MAHHHSNIVYLAATAGGHAHGSLTGSTQKYCPATGKRHGVFVDADQIGIGRLRGIAAFWWKAFSQRSIDLTLRTHAGLVTRIVESPGRSLSEGELEQLVSQLRVVAGKTLPAGSLTYGIFSGEPERLSRAVVTLIYEEATRTSDRLQRTVGNAGRTRRRSDRGHASRPRHGRSGCAGAGAVLGAVRPHHAGAVHARRLRPKWISNVTQVPAVCGMVSDTFSDVFPSPTPARGKISRICNWPAASCGSIAACSA